MKVACSFCNKSIMIPKEKIPTDKPSFLLKCPNCMNSIRVEPKMETTSSQTVSKGNNSLGNLQLSDNSYGYFDDNLALVAMRENSQTVSSVMTKIGFKPLFARNADDAISKVEQIKFKLIVMDETFDAKDAQSNRFLNHIAWLDMAVRRKIFVALIGRGLRTLDNLTAFANSTNIVINNKDIGSLENVIMKSMKENELFYKPMNRTLIDTGKEYI